MWLLLVGRFLLVVVGAHLSVDVALLVVSSVLLFVPPMGFVVFDPSLLSCCFFLSFLVGRAFPCLGVVV